jgi:hypothetical protein
MQAHPRKQNESISLSICTKRPVISNAIEESSELCNINGLRRRNLLWRYLVDIIPVNDGTFCHIGRGAGRCLSQIPALCRHADLEWLSIPTRCERLKLKSLRSITINHFACLESTAIRYGTSWLCLLLRQNCTLVILFARRRGPDVCSRLQVHWRKQPHGQDPIAKP